MSYFTFGAGGIHMNLAAKIILSPFIAFIIVEFWVLTALFSSNQNE